jgi:hypothetical protein
MMADTVENREQGPFLITPKLLCSAFFVLQKGQIKNEERRIIWAHI